MDPITFTLIALGATALIAMIFFLIDNSARYFAAISEANRRIIALEKEAKEKKERMRQREEDTRKIEELLQELRKEKEKFNKEETIAKTIDSIISGNPAGIVLNLFKLVQLIYSSYILKNNLKKPEESITEVNIKVANLEDKLNRYWVLLGDTVGYVQNRTRCKFHVKQQQKYGVLMNKFVEDCRAIGEWKEFNWGHRVTLTKGKCRIGIK